MIFSKKNGYVEIILLFLIYLGIYKFMAFHNKTPKVYTFKTMKEVENFINKERPYSLKAIKTNNIVTVEVIK